MKVKKPPTMISIRDVNRLTRARRKDFWNFLDDAGRISLNTEVRLGPYNGIKDCWKNKPAFVIGGSATIKEYDLNKLDGLNTIGINHMIEFYDKFKWFFFLDQRFLTRTTYKMKDFKGKIFAQNTCHVPEGLDLVYFKTQKMRGPVQLTFEKGLWSGALSGLCATHLALISGANPIYLLGCDNGDLNPDNYHYSKDGKEYQGEIKTKEKFLKYQRANRGHNAFINWRDRIVNVDLKGTIPTYKKISLDDFDSRVLPNIKKAMAKEKAKNRVKAGLKPSKTPVICHMIAMKSMAVMGDISRQVFNKSYGNHIVCNIENKPPPADIYLLECFINKSQQFVNFKKPSRDAKVISLIHSSMTCKPAKNSNAIVALTDAWKKKLQASGHRNITAIPAAIDCDLYDKHKIDYNSQVFGRISRYSPGKVHPQFNQIAANVLNKFPDSKCLFFTGRNNRLLKHERFILDSSIGIADHELKAKRMSEITIYADMHNTFVETFSLCLLEAMAAGCCIILYSNNPQPSMIEILDGNGIICNSTKMFENKIVEMLENPDKKKEYGLMAKGRAKEYTIKKMISQYDKLFKEVLK